MWQISLILVLLGLAGCAAPWRGNQGVTVDEAQRQVPFRILTPAPEVLPQAVLSIPSVAVTKLHAYAPNGSVVPGDDAVGVDLIYHYRRGSKPPNALPTDPIQITEFYYPKDYPPRAIPSGGQVLTIGGHRVNVVTQADNSGAYLTWHDGQMAYELATTLSLEDTVRIFQSLVGSSPTVPLKAQLDNP